MFCLARLAHRATPEGKAMATGNIFYQRVKERPQFFPYQCWPYQNILTGKYGMDSLVLNWPWMNKTSPSDIFMNLRIKRKINKSMFGNIRFLFYMLTFFIKREKSIRSEKPFLLGRLLLLLKFPPLNWRAGLLELNLRVPNFFGFDEILFLYILVRLWRDGCHPNMQKKCKR